MLASIRRRGSQVATGLALLTLTGCVLPWRTPPPAVSVYRLPTPFGEYWGLAWLPNGWLVVNYEPSPEDQSPAFRLWRLRPDGTELTQLPLGNHPDCHLTKYQLSTILPDGRLSISMTCVNDRRLPPGAKPDSLHLLVYDWETGATEYLIPPGKALAGGYTWNPAMTRGLESWGSGIWTGMTWVNRQGVEYPAFWVADGRRRWHVDAGYHRPAGQSCREEGRAAGPAWSPDGQTIAFWASPQSIGVEGLARLDQPWHLYLMDPAELQPRKVIADIEGPAGLDWSPDSRWLAFVGELPWRGDGLWLYEPATGTLRLVAKWEQEQKILHSPVWSPDGQQIMAIERTLPSRPLEYPGSELLLFDVSALVAAP